MPRSDNGASVSTIPPVRQHQTTEKGRREPIRTAEIMAEAGQSLQNNLRQSMRAMVKDLGMLGGRCASL